MPGNVLRNEYLARRVQAELLWRDEETSTSGADTDRGKALISFGPPDIRASFKFRSDSAANSVWAWRALGVHLFFRESPLFGTAFMSPVYRTEVFENAVHDVPAYFLALPGISADRDSLSVQFARFRGAGDTTDIAVSIGLRLANGGRGAVDSASTTRLGIFTVREDGSATPLLVESLRFADSVVGKTQERMERLRALPDAAGVRVDVLQLPTGRASRWVADVAPVSHSGFAVSDLLISERISPPSGAGATRWSDFTIQPHSTGVYSRRKPVDLLWELYEIAADAGIARYQVSITVQKEEQSGASAVVARVLNMAAGAVGVAARGRHGVSLSFERTAPAATVITESVQLDLSAAPTGRFTIRVEVLDRTSGRVVRSERAFHLVD